MAANFGSELMLWTNLQTTTAWLDANLEQFDPLPTGFPSYRSIKRFAELSIALMCIERLSRSSDGYPWLGNWVQRVTEFLTLNCGKPAYHEGLIKDPLGAFNFALPYLVLKRMGYRCTALDSVIERLLRNGLFLSVEMVPFRALDRLYFLKIGGRPTNPRDLVHWYRRTTIGSRKGVVVFNVEDTYSVTHTVFYMSDFGSDAKSLLDPIETERVLVILRSLLEIGRAHV